MSVKYQLRCFECDIMVVEGNDAYQLSIQSRSNPLGFGNRLAEYDTEERAKDAADHFCRMYTIAREYGYHLHGGEFRREDLPPIPVAQFLELRLTPTGVRALLDNEARIYGTPLTM
ncbi:hypothetical protein J19TS2_08290 [Cohnella xylanilytica]|uniref:Uncharacterized protein n=1 Tax=Cohnella xylanilytica TaxID=557555 RepID=A0A841TYD8_9BACL|nr:hypothetical protein [Cohnella xylanilytica]MBB6692092.1 hypothetical protein [Cohnella xylanilytica]GIO11274.1 hypothetical protein J19TS2_08290 [Cohnella xylanilytica]